MKIQLKMAFKSKEVSKNCAICVKYVQKSFHIEIINDKIILGFYAWFFCGTGGEE